MILKLKYRYYLYIFYNNNINSYFKLKLINELVIDLRNQIAIYINNFCYTQKL